MFCTANIQIYLELNHCTILYGEKYFLINFLTIILAANAGSHVICADK